MLKRYANVQQHDASDCGAAVIATILKTYKADMTIMKIREIIGTDAYGTSIKGIVTGLENLHFNVKAIKARTKDIQNDMTLPAIAHVKNKAGMNHLVVIHHISKKRVFTIADPAGEVIKQTEEEFNAWFTGVLVVCVPTSKFEKTKLKNKTMWSLYKMLILPQKRLFITVILTSFLLSLLGIVSGLFSKILVDEIIPYQMRNSLIIFFLIFSLIALIQTLLSAFRQHVLLFLSRKIDIPLLLGYYKHILNLPYFFFVTRKTGDVLTRFQDAMTVKEIFTSVSISLFLDISLSIIVGLVLININLLLFCILIVMTLINILLVYFFKKPYKELNLQQMEASAMLNSQIIESLRGIETIKSLADEQQQIDKLETKYVSSLKLSYEEGVLKNVQQIISSSVGSIGNLLFMVIGASYVINQNMSLGDLLVFQTLSQYFIEPVQNLVVMQLKFQESQIAITRLKELMDLEQENENGDSLSVDADLLGDIVFDHITFSYGTRAPILKDLNLVITGGSKIAIVGESGSGKSTLARLLLKFMIVDDGKIKINKTNILDINHTYLRQKIAYIPQNIELFSGTILDNLKVGNEDVSQEEIMLACNRASASSFIDRLPNRYRSFVEENGRNFSGGERQRLAIARSLLGQPDIFIFDEATSHLDVYSEKIVQDFIFKRIQSKTVIIIAHRLSTILNCDKIIFMEQGEIVEQGTHEQLMQQNGRYAKMVALQSVKSIDVMQHDKSISGEEMSYE
jgi:ATP-binding cassette subfamily B protein